MVSVEVSPSLLNLSVVIKTNIALQSKTRTWIKCLGKEYTSPIFPTSKFCLETKINRIYQIFDFVCISHRTSMFYNKQTNKHTKTNQERIRDETQWVEGLPSMCDSLGWYLA